MTVPFHFLRSLLCLENLFHLFCFLVCHKFTSKTIESDSHVPFFLDFEEHQAAVVLIVVFKEDEDIEVEQVSRQ